MFLGLRTSEITRRPAVRAIAALGALTLSSTLLSACSGTDRSGDKCYSFPVYLTDKTRIYDASTVILTDYLGISLKVADDDFAGQGNLSRTALGDILQKHRTQKGDGAKELQTGDVVGMKVHFNDLKDYNAGGSVAAFPLGNYANMSVGTIPDKRGQNVFELNCTTGAVEETMTQK